MRVLYLTQRLPYAPNRGDRTRAYHTLQVLAGRADVDLISLVHSADEEAHAGDLTGLVSTVATFRVRKTRQLRRSISAVATATPLTHALLDAPGLKAALVKLVASHRPDVVLAYCSGMVRFALEPPLDAIPFVLDMVDVDSEKWRELAARSAGPRRWIYLREARHLAAFEAAASRRAATALVVNEREGQVLRRLASSARVVVVGNGVALDALQSPRAPVEEPRVVFTGVMNYEPNEQAALWLAREVWPLVLAKRADARLLIVGASPTKAVQQLNETQPTVHVTGTVPDVREYLWTSAVSVAPIWTARGVQNKVLEAIAAGLPCVVTRAVFEGLPSSVQLACTVAADATSFATAITDLLALDGGARRAIAARANIHELTWQAQLSQLLPVLSEAAATVLSRVHPRG